MKKFVLAFTILLSSFFFFNSYVKAGEYSFNFDSPIISFYEENFDTLYNTATSFISSDSSLSNEFLITCFFKDTSHTFNFCALYILNNTNNYSNTCFKSVSSNINVYLPRTKYYSFTSDFTSLNYVKDYNGDYTFLQFYSNYSPQVLFYKNFDIPFDGDGSFTLLNGDSSYVFKDNNNLLSLYDILTPTAPSDIHLEEIDKLNSFYILCIDKLKYLSEVFLSNYIYLSIIVIFIIIFVFKLIFRRFL